MAMKLRLDETDAAAVAATAAREHISQHEVVVRAVRAYTAGRQERLDAAIDSVVTRDAALLERFGNS